MAEIIKALHTGISVLNMDEALNWYQENLDFSLVSDNYAEPLHARICFIKREIIRLNCFSMISRPPCQTAGGCPTTIFRL